MYEPGDTSTDQFTSGGEDTTLDPVLDLIVDDTAVNTNYTPTPQNSANANQLSQSRRLLKEKAAKTRKLKHEKQKSNYTEMQGRLKDRLYDFIRKSPSLSSSEDETEWTKSHFVPVSTCTDLLRSPETIGLAIKVLSEHVYHCFSNVKTYDEVVDALYAAADADIFLGKSLRVPPVKSLLSAATGNAIIAVTNGLDLVNTVVPDYQTAVDLVMACDFALNEKRFSKVYQVSRARVVQHINESLIDVVPILEANVSSRLESVVTLIDEASDNIAYFKEESSAPGVDPLDVCGSPYQDSVESVMRISAETFVEAFVSVFRIADQKAVTKELEKYAKYSLITDIAQHDHIVVTVSRRLRQLSNYAYKNCIYTGPGSDNEERLISLEDCYFDTFGIRKLRNFLTLYDLSFYGLGNEDLVPVVLSMIFDAAYFKENAPQYNLRATDALFVLVTQLFLPKQLGGYGITPSSTVLDIVLNQLSPSAKAGPRAVMLKALASSYNRWQWPHASLWQTASSELISESPDTVDAREEQPPTYKLNGSEDNNARRYLLHEGLSLCELEIKGRTIYCSLKQLPLLQKLAHSTSPIKEGDLAATPTEVLVLHEMVSKGQGLIKCAYVDKGAYFAFDPAAEFENGLSLVSAHFSDVYVA